MKIVLLLFSFFFLFSATNDCCISEFEEELNKITETSHSEDEHSEEEGSCEDCTCSTFCSYNIITVVTHASVIVPSSYTIQHIYSIQFAKVKNLPNPVFHPPIA